ncbi:putative secreted protein (Por secretion system target) [Tenacibaculum skagerrakense]|uniref:Putative secreted protein (Por secretion system target) n=1 Tax=Tenacibaculum skagerrakense TaxID=186571 RepID=A0A4R2NUD9_9FLAO|nr:endonuclease [Tenacibaculum skagerrakense]TCP25098.1 putative secreted protein (Por secretion system target) [Tenacibaculum skagerrakense]
MKKFMFIIMLFTTLTTLAQIPAYYNDVNLSLTGTDLKNELATKIINTHTNSLSYSNIWDASKITDVNPSNSSEVLLIYGYSASGITSRTRDINNNGGSNGQWNREHVFANSLANPDLDASGTSGPPYADAHNLRPCDVQTNSTRSNQLFADGTGNAGSVTGGWYPGDEWKGDVARIAMYMYLRYGNQCLPTYLGVGSSVGTPDDMIDLFLDWNAEDPVSDFEKQRNTYHDSAGTYAQGNRNPFIDNPAFATEIWGGPQAEDLFGGGSSDTEDPSVPTELVASSIAATSFTISWNASTDNTAVTGYNILLDNVQVGTSNTTSYNASGLTGSTSYNVTIQAYDAAGNTSASSSQLMVTTTVQSGLTSELLFSEYIEGSSLNKAVEIVNYTGGSVDLSVYSIKRQTNGAGAWSTGLALSGTLANGDVYVIANVDASTDITSKANQTSNGSEVQFNGNDPVGLFKNDVLIDIIGTFDGGSTNFAANTTLVRKSTVSNPNTTYTVSEWDSFTSDTFTNIGFHVAGTTNIFTGNTDSNWDTASNWSFATVPSNTDVMIGSGKQVTATGSISVADLTLETGASLTVGSNLTTSGTVTVNSGASLIAQNSTSFDLTYNRSLGTTNWYLVSSVVTNETIEDIISNHSLASGTAGNIGIGDYNNVTPGWTYANVTTTGTLASGEGRSIKLTTADNISFSGTMPLNDVNIVISDGGAGGNGFNLIGNPFPSYLTANNTSPSAANNLLSLNTGILDEETIWFWNQATNQYSLVNQATAILNGIYYIAPGQGFFVRSNVTGGSFTFPESMQSHQTNDTFARSSNQNYSSIKLKLSVSGSSDKETDILYIQGATAGWDNGWDSTIFDGANTDLIIYSELVENNQGQKLAIQSLSNDTFDEIIPLGINASKDMEITISAEAINLPDGYGMYLEDRVEGTFTLLDATTNYQKVLTENTNGAGRYYIHTSQAVLNVDENNLNTVSLFVDTNNTVHVKGIHEASEMTVFNITGQKVFATSFIGNGNNSISIPKVTTGLYLIQLNTNKGSITKKVILK